MTKRGKAIVHLPTNIILLGLQKAFDINLNINYRGPSICINIRVQNATLCRMYSLWSPRPNIEINWDYQKIIYFFLSLCVSISVLSSFSPKSLSVAECRIPKKQSFYYQGQVRLDPDAVFEEKKLGSV